MNRTSLELKIKAAVIILAAAALGNIYGQTVKSKPLRLGNKFVAENWTVTGGKLRAVSFEDLINKRKQTLSADVFTFVLKDGTQIRASELTLKGAVRTESLRPDNEAARFAGRLGGTRLVADLTDANNKLNVTWTAELRTGSQYIRQLITVNPTIDLPVTEIHLIDLDAPGAKVVGTVKGSPIVAGNIYFGFEHPLSESKVDGSHASAWMKRELPLRKGTKVTYSSVMGTTQQGQLRRDFLAYVERERAHPYRIFLHYNSWYDIGYFTPYTEKEALNS